MATQPSDVQEPLSLLWPGGLVPDPGTFQLCDENTIQDLELDDMARIFTTRTDQMAWITNLLVTLIDDPAVIRYRHEVLDDLLRASGLVECLQNLLPALGEIARLSGPQRLAQTPLQQVLWRLGELEMYVDCVGKLNKALQDARGSLNSQGMKALLAWTEKTASSEAFAALTTELPAMRQQVAGIKSLTVGINLDAQLRPIGAVLLDIRDEQFVERTLLDKLLKRQNEQQGIAVLHSMPPPPRNMPGQAAFSGMSGDNSQPLMHPLFRDVNTVMMHAAKPVAEALQRYLQTNASPLVALEPELVFYLGAAKLVERVRGWGLPMCKPEIVTCEERLCTLRGNYNLNLALRLSTREITAPLAETVVSNDVDFNEDGRIFILTGPNRGGKTTYAQAIGQTQVLAQAGLFVPAESARLSPVQTIHTHFPAAEKTTQERGRLGEEAKRLSSIFSQASSYCLIILNESLFSTSPGESLYLARDVVAALRLLGARAIYATHLHELAENLDDVNGMPGSSQVISLIAGVAEGENETAARSTYIIQPGAPRGRSYARAIAARYGINYDTLAEVVQGHLASQ